MLLPLIFFKFDVGDSVAKGDVDFSMVNVTIQPFRMCILTKTGLTLDWASKKVYITQVSSTTKICGRKFCFVNLNITNPEGFFSQPGSVRVWFERATEAGRKVSCSSQVPSGSSEKHSSAAYVQLTNGQFSGPVQMDFTNVNKQSTDLNPLQLCAYNDRQSVLRATFPEITMNVIDLALAPGSKYIITAGTGTDVKLDMSPANLLTGKETWFQLSSQECSKPTKASVNTTEVVKVISESVTTLQYDFSEITQTPKKSVRLRLCYSYIVSGVTVKVDASSVEVVLVAYAVTPGFYRGSQDKSDTISVTPFVDADITYAVFCREDVSCPSVSAIKTNLYQPNENCSSYMSSSPGTLVNLHRVQDQGKLLRLCVVEGNANNAPVRDLYPYGIYKGALTISTNVADKKAASTSVTVTWTDVLTSNASSVWFQVQNVACTTNSNSITTSASNVVAVKNGSFTGNFQFSTITTGVDLRMCANVGGISKDFANTRISLVEASLGSTSVVKAAAQPVRVSYTDLSGSLGTSVSAFLSSDSSCASHSNAEATAPVASVSGAVHSFDFSQGTPSMQKWGLCLTGDGVTMSLGFAGLYLVDVADLGAKFVASSDKQMLMLTSSVSLVSNDMVYFAAGDCVNGAKSTTVVFNGSKSYSFDFSSVTPSLASKLDMCHKRGNSTFRYSSASVGVTPVANVGTFTEGQRTLDLSSLSAYLVTDAQIAFVIKTAACDGATFVSATTTTHNFTTKGEYRLCVKTQEGVTDVSGVAVAIEACADVCSANRSTGVCNANGACEQCKAKFSGSRCDKCNAGYTGADCQSCDTKNNYQASADGTCAVCQCNGHYDTTALLRCPSNKCACRAGYTGDACGACQADHYKVESNATGSFTCQSCAAKCNSRASSCTSDRCQCDNKFDPANQCQFCLSGYVLNGTMCVVTPSPTAAPVAPTAAPVAPTAAPAAPTAAPVAPTAAPGCGTADTPTYQSQCAGWVTDGHCEEESQYSGFMKQNCAQSCCEKAKAAGCGTADTPKYKSQCAGWVGFCQDGQFSGFMKQNCAQSCCVAASPAPTAAPAAAPLCTKVNSGTYNTTQCQGWAKENYCQKDYVVFMESNCAQSCCEKAKAAGCGTADTPKYKSECAGWVIDGFCEESLYSGFMKKDCAQSCCECGTADTPADTPKYKSECAGWVGSGFCQDSQFSGFMKQNCARSCCLD